MLHHWRGTAFAPGAKAADFERLMKNFSAYPQRFSPQVVQAKVLAQQEDRAQATMRVRQHHVITVVMDTTYEINYGRLDPGHGYSMENERATYEGLLKLRPNERPFVLTRATYAGGQRYSFTWTGDNSATWNHVRLATQMLLNLGMSGISMVGDDIGGFNGSPSPDLLTSWIEIGAFNPMYRDHTTYGSLPQEVWVHVGQRLCGGYWLRNLEPDCQPWSRQQRAATVVHVLWQL